MKLLHVRHATSLLTYGGMKILIDPVFAEKDAFPPIPMTPNKRKNPLVGLSTPIAALLEADVVLCTHIHPDHFDEGAKGLLDKNIGIICQSEDAAALKSFGFVNVMPVEGALGYKNISITRVYAQHGTGAVGEMMGPASGYILKADGEPTVYITGDTIFNESVKGNIEKYCPDILIMNAGSPKFLNSDRIVMNILDIENTMRVKPELTFVIVHLETFNHCIETREDIHEYFSAERLGEMGVGKFCVPVDNEVLEF